MLAICVCLDFLLMSTYQRIKGKSWILRLRTVFLGYGATRKGYRLYDQKTSTIVHSRDVVFDELSRGYEGEKEKRLIQIENLTEENPETSNPAEEATRAESNEVNPGGGDTQPIDSIDRAEDSTDAPVLPRRSTRVSQRPDYYGVWVYTATEQQEEPHTVSEALSSTEKDQWKSAMQMEMDSIHSNDVWDLVELPAHRKAIGSKWVFRKKMNADGSIERYKARLVAQGFSQKQGLDFEETFCPVIRFESFRSLVAVAVQKGLRLHQLDITTAFLNGRLKEEVFMKQPEGFVKKGKEHLVCKLKQSLYGLKQSPRCWNHTLDAHLKDMGYIQSTNDPCIYTSSDGEHTIIGVYVDDFVIAAMQEILKESNV